LIDTLGAAMLNGALALPLKVLFQVLLFPNFARQK
jgi:hypothetical protein